MATVLWYILIGAVIGALARLILPGRNPMGVLLTILVGIVGAIIGGAIANALGLGNVVAFVFAIVIAVLVVALLSTFYTGGGAGRHGWHMPRRTH